MGMMNFSPRQVSSSYAALIRSEPLSDSSCFQSELRQEGAAAGVWQLLPYSASGQLRRYFLCFLWTPKGRALSSTEADRCREQFKLEVGASVAVDWVSTVKRLSAHSGTQEIRKDVEDKGSLLCQGRELRLWERDD